MKIVFAPDWFLTSDVMIDLFSFAVLCSFVFLAYRSYRLSKNRGTLYLCGGFFLIALAVLASILTKLVLYYDTSVTKQIGSAILTTHIISTVDIFYYIGFFFQRFFMLFGLYTIYRMPYENKITKDFLIMIYFVFLTSLLSHGIYFFYNLTALILLVSIVDNYGRTYKENKSGNTRMLIIAFTILSVSQVVFLFSELKQIYVAGQILQLVSYIIMLLLIAKIIKDGKEKKPSGNNPRHA